MPLEYAPRTRSIYSDLGFILLGLILESIDGRRMDDQFADDLASPGLLFRPAPDQRARTAPTEDDRAGADGCSLVKSTTRTRGPWTAWPDMPAFSARRAPWASTPDSSSKHYGGRRGSARRG
jgi:CubicO group peptidase (beta-lactamase class C family)